jgi:hypothetical protein
LIGRQEATGNPEAARRKVLKLFQEVDQLDDPASVLLPMLVDAVLIVEAYRGARHQIDLLPELTSSVDRFLKEIRIAEQAREWAE